MSKEVWLLAYERNLADGMSEAEAVKHADERAADIQASRLDAAISGSKEVTPSKSKDNS